MTAIDERPANRSIYLEGAFAPVDREIEARDCEVIGEVPRDLAGVYVRNGSNPRYEPKGRYHWFDGDGMLHALHFEDGRAHYRNRWVRTEAFGIEETAGTAVWSGINERPDFSLVGGPFKDTANTDLVYHAGRLLALWWLGGPCYDIALPSLHTNGRFDFHGSLAALSAHPKVDRTTGEMMVFDFNMLPPYLTYGVVGPDGTLTHHTDIELAGPRLLHDIAITERHTILCDFPLMWDPEQLARGRTKVMFDRDEPARFGVIPRHGDGATVRWFEASSCYMYHTINAWETDDEIVLVGCRIADPLANVDDEGEVPRIDVLRLEPYLHEWRFDLMTGAVRERALDDVMTEFPRMDNRVLGRASRYSYAPRIAHQPALLFDGFVKYDTDAGTSTHHAYGDGRFGGETVFAPRVGSTGEDDGYVLTFVADAATGASECVIVDARDVAAEPVGRVVIPQRVPIGYHSWWVGAEELG
jgi:carotenoid cleavage dioxygenase